MGLNAPVEWRVCGVVGSWYTVSILANTFLMNEGFPTVTGVETPMSAFEKHQAAMQDAQKRIAELMENQESQSETFVCPAGSERACENGWDIAIAKAQAKAAAAKKYIAEVEGINPHQELAAKKLLGYWNAQADSLLRQAELVSRGADLEALQIDVPEQEMQEAA